MKVVLRTDIPGVGKRGDITDVSDGFARNTWYRRAARLLPARESRIRPPRCAARAI